ncbi:pectin lyase fold/virulence factor [Desarmillaria tabescens]|uniref:Pectin lyase fold/virulence factor n=1 Tax=Armillaria tabescens TaxID=1929756 RepID=A0AA39J3J8_ARMTA|nr:pectin lyase fold/virulence factor [Desarmillaria tabescens]XP_060325319.1 pectin lyase fold/virulence factor [Desarmillaria tabescens]KAK0435475.1 pectin lyase fold/virulence factor [Desarmillaria tabescens]KAK0444972.1 pectin lyase fold/virulence factor [Desarmillaria tabescens]
MKLFLSIVLATLAHAGYVVQRGSVCHVHASDDSSDDAPAILSAFDRCGQGGTVVLNDELYHIESVMNTTGLRDVLVDLSGTMLWGTNITYWRSNGLPLGYQNQTTAWMFGGDRVVFRGHGVGTFDGNGQLWYDFTKGVSNLAGRPISLMITNTTNSLFSGIRFVQSQFWTMAIKNSEDVLLEGIYVNSTSNSSEPARNTDGVDTFYSNRITFRNWTVTGGDDDISLKANSTNILIQDSVFHAGFGLSIGSIGQYPGVFERIENVTAERVACLGTSYAGWIKTWTGIQQGYPPNGGGGGLGYARNITFRDFVVQDITDSVAYITQCTSYIGATGGCDTSLFQISDITWESSVGNVASEYLAELQCSGAAPCTGIRFGEFDDIATSGSRTISCSNVLDPVGFNCTT